MSLTSVIAGDGSNKTKESEKESQTRRDLLGKDKDGFDIKYIDSVKGDFTKMAYCLLSLFFPLPGNHSPVILLLNEVFCFILLLLFMNYREAAN